MTYPSLLKVTAAETNVITETQTPPIFDEIEDTLTFQLQTT